MTWIACLTLTVAAATAVNDGGITFGGSPTLLSSHPTVSMETEVVRIRILPKVVKVECEFEFRNTGPACSVRMGFPDSGAGESDYYQEVDPADWQLTKIRPYLLGFKSWVNGKLVKTEFVRGKELGEQYHAKTVAFPANSKVRVRDTYTTNHGGGITPDGRGFCKSTAYILRSGASWKGKIKKATVIVDFDAKELPIPGELDYRLTWEDVRFSVFEHPERVVVCNGLKIPTWKGRRLTFVKTNFEPTEADDVNLLWGYKGPAKRG